MTCRRPRLVVWAVAPLALLVACSTPSVDPSPTPASTAGTVAVTPTGPTSPTASTPSTTDPAPQPGEREVLALVAKYYRVDEQIAKSKRVPLDKYYLVAAGDYAQSLLQNAQQRRARGYRAVGNFRVGRPEILHLDTQRSKADPPAATVRTCVDVRDVNLVDKRGKSVVSPNRADAYIERLTLRKKSAGWRVVKATNRGTTRCTA